MCPRLALKSDFIKLTIFLASALWMSFFSPSGHVSIEILGYNYGHMMPHYYSLGMQDSSPLGMGSAFICNFWVY